MLQVYPNILNQLQLLASDKLRLHSVNFEIYIHANTYSTTHFYISTNLFFFNFASAEGMFSKQFGQ